MTEEGNGPIVIALNAIMIPLCLICLWPAVLGFGHVLGSVGMIIALAVSLLVLNSPAPLAVGAYLGAFFVWEWGLMASLLPAIPFAYMGYMFHRPYRKTTTKSAGD